MTVILPPLGGRMTTRTILALVLAAGALQAEDGWIACQLTDLTITSGALPGADAAAAVDAEHAPASYTRRQAMRPYAVLQSAGEAYVNAPAPDRWEQQVELQGATIAIH